MHRRLFRSLAILSRDAASGLRLIRGRLLGVPEQRSWPMRDRDPKPRPNERREGRRGDDERTSRSGARPRDGTSRPRGGRGRPTAVSDGLVLAAVDRAYRHGSEEGRGAPIWSIIDHLAIAKRTNAAREVRARLSALEGNGLMRASRRHGVAVWALTWAGKRRLEGELRSSCSPRLPESPQHRAWRNARELAAQESKRFREILETTVNEAVQLAAADPRRASGARGACAYWRRPVAASASAGPSERAAPPQRLCSQVTFQSSELEKYEPELWFARGIATRAAGPMCEGESAHDDAPNLCALVHQERRPSSRLADEVRHR